MISKKVTWKRLTQLFALSFVVAGYSFAPGCTFALDRDKDQCSTNQDCLDLGASFAGTLCGPQHTCVKQGGCDTAQECVTANNNTPFICRHSDRTCVPLENKYCHVLAKDTDIGSENTIWIGGLFAQTGQTAKIGMIQSGRAVDIARSEVSDANGLPSLTVNQPRRSVAVVACDDGADMTNPDDKFNISMDLLANQLHVPAIIGFATSQNYITAANTYTIPQNIYTTSGDCASSAITTLLSSNPRLVWRTIPGGADAGAVGAAPGSIYESLIRSATPPVLNDPKNDPIKVAVIYKGDALGKSGFAAVQSHLSVNQKNLTDNGDNVLAISYGDPSATDFSPSVYLSVAAQVAMFQPHVILMLGTGELWKNVAPNIEMGLQNEMAPFSPYYIMTAGAINSDLFTFIGTNDALRKRVTAANFTTDAVPINALVSNYNSIPSNSDLPITSASATLPGGAYDAFYSIVYAMIAANTNNITGPAIAQGMAKLVVPGNEIIAGPATYSTATGVLSTGGSINFKGIHKAYNWDLTTGDPAVAIDIQCITKDATTMAATSAIASGIVYDPKTGMVSGMATQGDCLH